MTSAPSHGPAPDRVNPPWRAIESQADLDALDGAVDWHDAEPVAFVADTAWSHPFFPDEVARSGYLNWNARVAIHVGSRDGSHLELVLVDCDALSLEALRGLHLRGRVDALKRVEVTRPSGERMLRCSRLLWRFVDRDPVAARRLYGFGEARAADDL
jgi:hypothetical protein